MFLCIPSLPFEHQNVASPFPEVKLVRDISRLYPLFVSRTQATIILASGFCALAGDLGAQLAIAALNNTDASAEIHVDAWLEKYNGGLSAGVIATKPADKNASYPKAWDTDPYVLAPNASAGLKVDTLVQGMEYPEVSGFRALYN